MLAHERKGVAVAFEHHDGIPGLVPHLRVSWDAYLGMVDELVVRIARGPVPRQVHAIGTSVTSPGWAPNQIVAITFGGIVPARAISEALGGIPLAYFGAESYRPAEAGDRRQMAAGEEIAFARDLLKTRAGFGNRVLIVDDLVDRGRTLRTCREWLRRHPAYGIDLEVSTACLWEKEGSAFTPDVCIDDVVPIPIPGDSGGAAKVPWIDQPMESSYATTDIEAIEERIDHRAMA